MHHYGLRELFIEKNCFLSKCLYKLKLILTSTNPRLAQHFEDQGSGLKFTTCGDLWGQESRLRCTRRSGTFFDWRLFPPQERGCRLLTIFSYRFPTEHTYRIWDVFLMEGFDRVIATAVAIINHFERELLPLKFEEIIFFLKGIPSQLPPPDFVLRAACDLKWVLPRTLFFQADLSAIELLKNVTW